MNHILIVDDEELVRSLVSTILSRLGYSFEQAVDGVDALSKMETAAFDAVITDVRMPRMDGIILTREISNKYPDIPVMVMTAYDDEYSAGTAMSMGAREFMKKPFSVTEFTLRLQKMIRDAVTLKSMVNEARREEEGIDSLKGEFEKILNEKSMAGTEQTRRNKPNPSVYA